MNAALGSEIAVSSYRHLVGAVECRPLRQQKAGATEHLHPPSEQDAIRGLAAIGEAELPQRQERGKCKEADHTFRLIPQFFRAIAERETWPSGRASGMNDDNRRVMFPPFPAKYRASGILLHVASLPWPYGIGDVGAGGAGMGRPPPRGEAKLVAGAAVGSHGVRQLSLSVAVVLRRQRASDQSGRPDRGRIAASKRLPGQLFLGISYRLQRRYRIQAPPPRNGLD